MAQFVEVLETAKGAAPSRDYSGYAVYWGDGGHWAADAGSKPADTVEPIVMIIVDPTPPNTVRTSASPPLDLPPAARVQQAVFQVTIDPPGRARISDVAEVRSNTGDGDSTSFTVDFAGLRTVNAFELPVVCDIYRLSAWMGTAFADQPFYEAKYALYPPTTAPSLEFTEVMTERIKLDLFSTTSISVDDVLAGEVVIPTPPASVEIVVNDVRAWFSPIDATTPKVLTGTTESHSLAIEVDLRDAIQTAVDETGSVAIELRATGPCQMTIGSANLTFLRTHTVQFPDGPSRTIDAPTEGVHVLDLPLDGSPGADQWDIQAVELRAIADLGPTRIQPATGPTLAADVELVLSGERTLLVRVPHQLLDRYERVTGVRVPLRAAAGGAELAAELLLHDSSIDGPGSAVEGATFRPLTAAESSAFEYVTVELEEPYEPETGADLWMSLRSSRGELSWGLGEVANGSPLEHSEVRWKAPSGVARSLSTVAEVASLRGGIRLVGEAGANQPIAALDLTVAARNASTALTPIPAGVDVSFALEPAPPVSPVDQGLSGVLRLELLAAAPGSYTFDSAVVVYRDPALDGAPS